MIDAGMTANLLEERLMLVEDKLPEEMVLPMAMRSAMRHLRERNGETLYTLEEVRSFRAAIEVGAEIACYLERKGYYRIEACIITRVHDNDIRITDSAGMHIWLKLEDYGKIWRLLAQWPDGLERHGKGWE